VHAIDPRAGSEDRIVGVLPFFHVFANTCVLNTAFTAFNHDYRVIVLSDCVASMYGDDLDVLGLQNVARCLGWVLTNDELRVKLADGARA